MPQLLRPPLLGRLAGVNAGAVDSGAAILALGPAAWYRYGLGITSSGGAASQWADQSGNGRHLVQTTEAQKPTVDTDGSLLFDGVNDRMAVSFTLAQPETIFILWKPVAALSATNAALLDGVANLSACPIGISARIMYVYSDAGASVLANDANGWAPATGSYGVNTLVVNNTSSSLQLNNNTAATGTLAEGASPMGGFTLATRGGGSSPSNINVMEAIVFAKTLSAGETTTVKNYLYSLGGVTP